MGKFAEWNDNVRFLLMVIDAFSKFGWIKPLKDKRGISVEKALSEIFQEGRTPKMLWTDKGKEFYNSNVKKFLEENGVMLYSTFNDEKNSVVERWNKTIKEKIWRMFSANNNIVYIDKL